MNTDLEVKIKRTSKITTDYSKCPICLCNKVRTFFGIKNNRLFEKKLCMVLDCPYTDFTRFTDELEIRRRLKNGF